MSPLKQLVAFGEKSVFEESGFPLEKEESTKYAVGLDETGNQADQEISLFLSYEAFTKRI